MSLRIRRGTNTQRLGATFDLGEIAYTTDTQKLYVGDGVNAGGRHVLASSAGNGLTFNETSQQLELSVGALTLTTSNVTEATNLYFTAERAQDAVAAAFTAGQSLGNVTFSYDDTLNKLYANVVFDGVGLASVSADTTPALGGSLALAGHDISGTGNISVTGTISATGTITASSFHGAVLLTSQNITGTGNISITGSITSTSVSTNTIIPVDTLGNVTIDATSSTPLRVKGISSGDSTANIQIAVSDGTSSAPTDTVAGQVLGGVVVTGYHGGIYKDASFMITQWDSAADFTKLYPKSSILFATGNNGDVQTSVSASLDGIGNFTARAITPGVYADDASRDLILTAPVPGMMVFNTALQKFQGYVADTGLAATGGVSNGIPGWFSLH